MPACPVCLIEVASDVLEWHVNAHFEGEGAGAGAGAGGGGGAGRWKECTFPGCQYDVTEDEWDSHQLAHRLEATGDGTTGGANASQRGADGDCIDLTESPARESNWAAQANGAPPGPHGGLSVGEIKDIQVADVQYKPQEAALTGQRNVHSVRAALSAAPVMHFESRADDSGWACGWRNIQMLTSHLFGRSDGGADYRRVLFGGAGFVPEIESLQMWMEAAWAAGFDREGRAQLGGRVVGTTKWIGATECSALLRYFGVRAQLVDFTAERKREREPPLRPPPVGAQATLSFGPSGALSVEAPKRQRADGGGGGSGAACSSGREARDEEAREREAREREGTVLRKGAEEDHRKLVDWLWRYFTTDWAGNPLPAALGQQVVHSAKPPLFFQHQGHSRTVVGVERRRLRWDSEEETLLLILDPSSRTGELVGKLRSGAGWQGLVKRGLQTLRGREYQIVAVQQGIAKEGEREALKEPEFLHVTVGRSDEPAAAGRPR